LLDSALTSGDSLLIREFIHAYPLVESEQKRKDFQHTSNNTNAITKETREKLFNNMMNHKLYWGDQYAIQSLENLLNVKILIFKKHKENGVFVPKNQIGWETNKQNSPFWHIILILHKKHYLPLAKKVTVIDKELNNNNYFINVKGEKYTTIFSEENIPLFIKNICKR
jgi:hypothetical protein